MASRLSASQGPPSARFQALHACTPVPGQPGAQPEERRERETRGATLLNKVDRDGDRCPFVNDDVKGPGELFLRELLPPNPE